MLGALLYFLLAKTSLKSQFEKQFEAIANKNKVKDVLFDDKMLASKPDLLQNFIKYCGFYNKPMMKYTYTKHINADFLLNDDKPMTKIQYTHVNFASVCERTAFINTKIASIIPFQGLDDNVNGKGRMKGVVGRLFTVFNIQGKEMDAAALVTVLSEGAICPSFLMHEDITWEEVDKYHVKATLKQYGITVSGVFEFNDNGAIIGFYTKDRYEEHHGVMTPCDWRITCSGYKERDGFMRPTIFQAFWMYPETEKIYFDCDNVAIEYFYD